MISAIVSDPYLLGKIAANHAISDIIAVNSKLISALMKYDVELYKVDISGYDDVGSMTAEEYQKRKEAAMFMSSDNYLYYRALTAF